jgi:5-methylcytosine-specific restriction endonuclease McrA
MMARPSSPSLDPTIVQRAAATFEATVLKERARARDWYNANHARARQRQADHYAANRDAILEQQREYQDRTADQRHAQQSEYAKAHRAEIAAQKKRRRQEDEPYRLMCNQRSRLKRYLLATKTVKSAATFKLIGCTAAELRQHLTRQLPQGVPMSAMTVDHIFPLKMYRSDQQHRFMHWSNTQPLTMEANRDKWDRLPTKAMAANVERWAWPDGVSMDDLPESLQRDSHSPN